MPSLDPAEGLREKRRSVFAVASFSVLLPVLFVMTTALICAGFPSLIPSSSEYYPLAGTAEIELKSESRALETETTAGDSSVTVVEPNNRTLVVAIGSLDAGDETTWQSLYNQLLDPQRADLALFLDKLPAIESSLLRRAKYSWTAHSNQTLQLPAEYGWLPQDMAAILAGLPPISELIGDLTQHYDRFILTRAEFFHICHMDLNKFGGGSPGLLDDGTLVLPSDQVKHVADIVAGMIAEPGRYNTNDTFRKILARRIVSTFKAANLGFARHPPISFRTTTDASATRVPEGVRRIDRKQYIQSREGCARLHPPELKAVPEVSTTASSTPSRTLVIVMGNIRGGELAWQSLYRNVLNVNNADLALMVGDTAPRYQNASLFQRAEYNWRFQEYEDWADALDLINGTSWRTKLIPLVHPASTILGGVKARKFSGSGGVIFMIRWFLAKKIFELDLTSKYDRFIITRSDHYYSCEHDVSELDPNLVWIPDGEDWRGITDRHHILPAKYVLQALNILPPLLASPERYREDVQSIAFNPETLLRRRWDEEGILPRVRRFPRVLFTCGQDGDMTRWMKLGTLVEEGVRLKYTEEYYDSHVTCYNRQFKETSEE